MKFINISIIQSAWSCCVIFTMTFYIFYYPAGNGAILAYLEYNCKTCSAGQIMAMHDFEKGIARLTQDGMGDSDRATIRAGILKQDYGIETVYTGCVGTTDEVYCYMNMMARMLAQKYGWDFYDRASKKTRDIIEKRPPSNHKYKMLVPPARVENKTSAQSAEEHLDFHR
jgi:hypothetical protein